jgi:L-lactate dehydrogenase
MTDRYDSGALKRFAAALFTQAGLDEDKASVTADILVEGDLLGHTTHGLALIGQNLDELRAGRMLGTGAPEIIAAVSIHRSCHIACLAAYLRPIAERGQMLILASSDPSTASVAPFGGTRRLYTPNPLAAGWPTPAGPVMLDVSMSNTTNGMTGRLRAAGETFEHPWLLDHAGRPTNDPNAFFTDPPGSLLPLGGMETGHKGYALGLLIEALTSALTGYGRADGETAWGAAVLVLVLDPDKFGGADRFAREAGWMADAVHANPPIHGRGAPRLPGERGLALRADQLAHGVALHPSVPPILAARARAAGIEPPRAIA